MERNVLDSQFPKGGIAGGDEKLKTVADQRRLRELAEIAVLVETAWMEIRGCSNRYRDQNDC
jgi:hypothetical protein